MTTRNYVTRGDEIGRQAETAYHAEKSFLVRERMSWYSPVDVACILFHQVLRCLAAEQETL